MDEIKRIQSACGESRFKEPHNFGTTKIDNFNELLSEQTCIAVTHSTFLNATPQTCELIEKGKYILILDESLDVITDFNDTHGVESSAAQKMGLRDIQIMLEKEFIKIREDYLVEWIGPDCQNTKFSEVERLARLHRLYFARGKMFVCVFPPELFQQFKQVYILTYLLGGSDLKNYFDLFKIDYTLSSIAIEADSYYLTDYSSDTDYAFRTHCKDLIEICDIPRLTSKYKTSTFTKSWFQSNIGRNETTSTLKQDLTYFFYRIANAKASNYDIMWTCPADFKEIISGKGYTCVRKLRKTEKMLPKDEQDKINKQLSCFVSLNAKATNDYSNRWALAYCANMKMNPMKKGFLQDSGVIPDEDLFALSCLIQWMFRSRIRNGEKIIIFIPSSRMRTLLKSWLDCAI